MEVCLGRPAIKEVHGTLIAEDKLLKAEEKVVVGNLKSHISGFRLPKHCKNGRYNLER